MRFLYRLLAIALFSLALAMSVNLPFAAVFLPLAIVAVTLRGRAGSLAMNGIEAREDFNNVVKIFDNAFNPRLVFDTSSRMWVPNPKYDALWDPVSAFRLTQSTVRMEQPMSNTTTQYLFPILNNINNQQAPFNTEIRLAQQDTFVPTHVGFFLAYPSGATDTTFKLNTYPNQVVSAQPVQEQAYYNGNLSIMVNNVQYTQNWDIWRHWRTNQTQQTAALGAASPEDQLDGSQDGWYPMQPFIMMIGSQNIRINLNLPVSPSAVTANGRLVIMFRGVLGQQSTVVN